ncbi:hypothetical protein [Bifidobacterium leontopitheci]|uniref:DUF4064 domain-containing protein n=1 Tax=Bifidobacterium leontopitheci TaxID=2650774 RepID=A0A6I1GR65_9BIFI|nr:hypothetical protein [Bifidobacterium leontopitheci]KAB7790618.1 hypothetical protein F7D09_0871 [Bifidobacterium leontopitheci]
MTSKMNNYMRARAKANERSPYSKRTPERVIMCIGAVYSVAMAVFFALAYGGLIPGMEDAAQASSQTLQALTRNASNTALVIFYVIVTAAVAAATVVVAVRFVKPGLRNGKVIGWMIFTLVYSMITADTIGLLAFGIAFGLYMTRDWQLIKAVMAAKKPQK